MKKTYIYSLVCPLDGKVKYIGKSNNPYLRFSKHKSLSDKNTGVYFVTIKSKSGSKVKRIVLQ